ncbi:MAG TPA: hypothetical protein VJ860_15500 [Polyangia bacterium]|nr:hypothetical protein [Polyangia bacterium]
MRSHKDLFVLAAVTALAPCFASCAVLEQLAGGLGQSNLAPPTITFQGATLARAPSQSQLAAYYCPDVVSAPFGATAQLCQTLFGPRPGPAAMTVAFDLRFRVANPNHVPIPLASVLTAVTVFPARASKSLGAVCLQLCAEGQPGCTGQAAPGACQASSRDVRSLGDFAGAAANLLIANGIAAATGQPLTFAAPKVSAASQMDVTVRFSFGPNELLGTLKQLASQSVNDLQAGRSVSFSIPYRIEGTVWFDAGSIGRIAVGFGPAQGTWVLPIQGLFGG